MTMIYKVIRISFKNSVAYRFNTLVSILTNVFVLLVQVSLWTALITNTDTAVITLSEMITYLTIGVLLTLFYNPEVAHAVGSKVQDGSIGLNLIKPFSFSAFMFFQSAGLILSDLFVKGLVFLIFAFIVFDIHLNTTFANVALLCIVLPMNIFLFWLMHYIIGLLHFIFINAGWFARVLRDTIQLLSGAVIPLWFFPDVLKQVAYFLPFQILYQFPQSLVINKISSDEIIHNIIVQIGWLVILIIIARLLWTVGTRKIVIQGG